MKRLTETTFDVVVTENGGMGHRFKDTITVLDGEELLCDWKLNLPAGTVIGHGTAKLVKKEEV